MTSDSLPEDVVTIIEYLARMARGYDNHLKWNEDAKFKGDLMNARWRWLAVSPDAFASRALAEGMRAEDVYRLREWLVKAQSGRRLVPQHSYRTFKFAGDESLRNEGS